MTSREKAAQAAKWARDKVGCEYSQPRRMEPESFDCSSLVGRSYTHIGKKWFYGGECPISCQEVYDDEFELYWPAGYQEIGKTFGDKEVISKCRQPGDVQFICTDRSTSRSNRITHVAMVADAETIVHARGKAYGVCTNSIWLYSDKVCAVARYNPDCTLRKGMKGYRTLALQKALCERGIEITVDGDYGSETVDAVKTFQNRNGLEATGQADEETLAAINSGKVVAKSGLKKEAVIPETVRITGEAVHIRTGPNTVFPAEGIAKAGDMLDTIYTEGWIPVVLGDRVYWVSGKYAEYVDGGLAS